MNEMRRDELKQSIDSKETIGEDSKIILIDVREPLEVQTYGSIPTSINIPLNQAEKELSMSAEEFQKKYGKTISKEKKIVFYCRSGTRSEIVAKTAESIGYRNVYNYKGSALEWSEIDPNVKRY